MFPLYDHRRPNTHLDAGKCTTVRNLHLQQVAPIHAPIFPKRKGNIGDRGTHRQLYVSISLRRNPSKH